MNNQGLSNSQDPDIEGNAEAEQDDLESLFNDISGAMNDRGKLNKLLNAPDDPNKSGQKRSTTGVITEVSDEDEGLVGPDGRVKADTDTDISEEPDEDDSEPEADTGEAKPAEAKEGQESEKEQTDGEDGEVKPVPEKPRKPSAIKEVKKYLDTLPPDARKAVSQLMKEADKARKEAGGFKHQYESQQGRMAAIQRDVADLRTQLTLSGGSTKPPANSGAAANRPPGSTTAQPALRVTESARFKKLQEVDPEMAELLVEALSEQTNLVMQEANAKIDGVRASTLAAEQQRYVSRQREIVREAIPYVEQVTSTPQFKDFYESSSPPIKALAESIHSEDSFAALQLYANWLGTHYPGLVKKPATSAAPTTTAKSAADKVLEDRANRLKVAGSAAVSPTRPTPPEKEPEDEESLFKYWEKKLASR